jgi:peptide/nickel transport system substrate-binding protein
MTRQANLMLNEVRSENSSRALRYVFLATYAVFAASNAAAQGASSTPVKGGNLTYGITSYPPCLDRVQSNPNPVIFSQVVDNLLDQDPATGKLVPYLADRWSVADQARTYTFHLRSGVTFSNGEVLDAKVVVQNFSLTAKLAQQGSASAAQTFLKDFDSATATDGSTVVIRFKRSNPGFEQAVTEKGLAILAPATLAAPLAERCAKGVIGSGPFVATQIRPNERVVFKKRAGYNWGSAVAAHKGEAYLDTLTLQVVPEASVRVGSLQNGELDGFFDARRDDHASIEASGAVLIPATSAGLSGSLLVNTSKPGLSDLAVRQALEVAINRAELVDALFGPRVKTATGLLSANHPDHLDQSAQLAYDPQKAIRLLDAAGWKPGRDGIRVKDGQRLSIQLTFSGVAEQSSFEVIQQQVRQVGIDLKLASIGVAEQVERRASGNWSLDWRTWGRADADVLYYILSTEASPARGVTPRPEFEAQLNRAATEPDRTARAALARRIQTTAIEQGYVLPIREITVFNAFNKNVHGFRVTLDPWSPSFLDAWVEPHKKS